MDFVLKLKNIQNENKSILCVGLDPELDKIPVFLQNTDTPLFAFNQKIIDATFDLVCAYKPNMAFYEAYGLAGLEQLKQTIDYLKKLHPDIPVILDGKRGDIGNSSKMYAQMAFEYFDADALTVNPYLGLDSLEPFLKYEEKFIFVLVKTSNPGSDDFQNLPCSGHKLYEKVAQKLEKSDANKTGIVVGATYPNEIKILRRILPQHIFLIPGIGVQGGDVKNTLKYGLDGDKKGIVINVSRSVLYAHNGQNFAKAARKKTDDLVKLINKEIK